MKSESPPNDTLRFGAKYCMRCSRWTDHRASHCSLPNPRGLTTEPTKTETHLGWPWPKGSNR